MEICLLNEIQHDSGGKCLYSGMIVVFESRRDVFTEYFVFFFCIFTFYMDVGWNDLPVGHHCHSRNNCETGLLCIAQQCAACEAKAPSLLFSQRWSISSASSGASVVNSNTDFLLLRNYVSYHAFSFFPYIFASSCNSVAL